MTREFQASKPIYSQIADHIAYKIVRGEIEAGEKLPSVREMAIRSGVNPNTIQRTYSELEGMGIVATKRGQGTFVSTDSSALGELKERLQTEVITAFIRNMEDIGQSREEIIEAVHVFLGGEKE